MAMSDQEYQQAQAAVSAESARRAAEAAAANAERLAPLVAVTSAPEFATLKGLLAALPADLAADDQIGPCIKAVRVGMDGILRFAPPATAPATVA